MFANRSENISRREIHDLDLININDPALVFEFGPIRFSKLKARFGFNKNHFSC